MTHPTEKQNILQTIKSNWFLVLFVGSVIIGWTSMNMQTQVNAGDIGKLNTRIEHIEKVVADSNIRTEVQYSQIQTDLQWIKAKLK